MVPRTFLGKLVCFYFCIFKLMKYLNNFSEKSRIIFVHSFFGVTFFCEGKIKFAIFFYYLIYLFYLISFMIS